MKLNSKRRETESGTQPRGIRDQNNPSNGSKLEPFLCNYSKRAKPNLECNHAAYATKMIRVSLETCAIHETKFEM